MLAKLQFWKLFLDLMVVARFHLKVASGLRIVELSQTYLFLSPPSPSPTKYKDKNVKNVPIWSSSVGGTMPTYLLNNYICD